MKRVLHKRIAPLVVVLAMGLAGTSIAVAYWTTSASGGGTAATGSAQAITLSAGAPTGLLYPGGQGDVALTIVNPNLSRVHIAVLSLSGGQGAGGYDVDSAHSGCATSALSYATQTNGGLGWSVPARVGTTDGSLSLQLADALSLSASAAGACQGATFAVYLSASP